MLWVVLFGLLLIPMQLAVVLILGRFFLAEAKGPLARLREPAIRRDFFWLMLTSGMFTATVVLALARWLPGGG